jgi:hypothetical protein
VKRGREGNGSRRDMLISQDMLRIHQKSLGTYQRMLIGQDMLIASMLIARFNCKTSNHSSM